MALLRLMARARSQPISQPLENARRTISTGWIWLAMLAVSFALILPALIMGDALSGDARVHILWQAHFADAVWHGALYPRWLPDMNDGFGSPAFFFYPPLLQWAGSLFYPLLPLASDAASRLILGVWLVSVAGGAGCLLWLRALGIDRPGALLGALVFLLMPYRCFADVYQRGAVAEMTAICMIPWLLCFATRLKTGRPGSWGGYAFSTAALLFSNLPGAEIGILFVAAYSLALAGRGEWAFLLRAATALLTGSMIGAINVATLLGYFDLLPQTTELWAPRYQPVNWLLFSAVPWHDPSVYRMTLGLSVFGLVAGGVLAAMALPVRPVLLRRAAVCLVTAILVTFILNTAAARPFWALPTPLARIQFPFRLLAVQVLALSGLVAIALDRLDHAGFDRAGLLRRLLWLCVPGLLVSNAGFLAIQTLRHPDIRPLNARQIVASSVDASEYVLGDLDLLHRRFGMEETYALSGSARARLITRESRHIAIEVNTETTSRLAVRAFAFTGWEYRIDQGRWSRAAALPYPMNTPVCVVPPGRHVLELRLPAAPFEKIGWTLTLLGTALAGANLLLGMAGAFRRTATDDVKDAAEPR